MAREAVHMRLRWKAPLVAPAAPRDLCLRVVGSDDDEALGTLMSNAYRGTIDDEGETPEETLAQAHATFAGSWGPLIERASLVAVHGGDVVAMVITVRDAQHAMAPLIAFALTDPMWQRQGIGSWLIRESVCRLSSLGINELHLAVTRGSPAQRLYERLGFEEVA